MNALRTRRLEFNCAVCGSRDVIYSCEPKCCFNHVCADCRSTFEPVTRAAPGRVTGIKPPDPLPECTDPTVACARCDSTRVYLLDDSRLVCAACGQVLELELTEICPAQPQPPG